MKSPLHFNPIMEGFMTSICVDIFDMTRTVWMEQVSIQLLICVDWGSG